MSDGFRTKRLLATPLPRKELETEKGEFRSHNLRLLTVYELRHEWVSFREPWGKKTWQARSSMKRECFRSAARDLSRIFDP